MAKEKEVLQGVAAEWFECRNIIKKFLQELRPGMSEETLDHNAAALIARLAGAGYLLEKTHEIL